MRRYLHGDYSQITDWFARRKVPPPRQELLPAAGVIVEHVAVGFLIATDANIGILDYFCTNPDAEDEDRLNALESIGRVLIAMSRAAGMKAIACNTQFSNIKKMALNQGFVSTGEYSSFVKEL